MIGTIKTMHSVTWIPKASVRLYECPDMKRVIRVVAKAKPMIITNAEGLFCLKAMFKAIMKRTILAGMVAR
ncbi:hypothetical protein GCM10023151_02500 [Kangiella marina]|uniref:Uncharacterized protein n=1 Tax=Kangiella marina TaxID=1079178 RepID=A0ABP8IC10_9GAMM